MIDTGLQRATASAPATVSNVGVGFDILGFSLTGLSDQVTVCAIDAPEVRIGDIDGRHASSVPTDAERNTASAALIALREARQLDFGFEVHITKGVPLHSGLGGSAASAVAAIVAASALLDQPLTLAERATFALHGEEAACGERKADNICPSIMGGMVLIRSLDPFDVVRIPVPQDMGAVIAIPDLDIEIQQARAILNDVIDLQEYVAQSANLAGFVAGCYSDDRALIARCLQDLIVEPQRSHLIPGFADVQKAALAHGAMGASIAGAGPSLFALHDRHIEPRYLADAMAQAFDDADVDADLLLTPIQGLAAHIIERHP